MDPDLKGIINAARGSEDVSVNEMIVTIGIVAMTVLLPTWMFFRYLGQRAMGRVAQAPDQQASAELWERARRMETRIEYLERVLDAEMPGWRNRS